jgi:5-methylcytosine-specific restriction endonuclease McrA
MGSNRRPGKPEELAAALHELRLTRRRNKRKHKAKGRRRKALTRSERATVLRKTDGRCHICGGAINGKWQADHVLAHSGGGTHSVENYLPAHALCNNYRWDYTDEEFQYILKLGVWLRTQIESETRVGREVAARFLTHEASRLRRRRTP